MSGTYGFPTQTGNNSTTAAEAAGHSTPLPLSAVHTSGWLKTDPCGTYGTLPSLMSDQRGVCRAGWNNSLRHKRRRNNKPKLAYLLNANRFFFYWLIESTETPPQSRPLPASAHCNTRQPSWRACVFTCAAWNQQQHLDVNVPNNIIFFPITPPPTTTTPSICEDHVNRKHSGDLREEEGFKHTCQTTTLRSATDVYIPPETNGHVNKTAPDTIQFPPTVLTLCSCCKQTPLRSRLQSRWTTALLLHCTMTLNASLLVTKIKFKLLWKLTLVSSHLHWLIHILSLNTGPKRTMGQRRGEAVEGLTTVLSEQLSSLF